MDELLALLTIITIIFLSVKSYKKAKTEKENWDREWKRRQQATRYNTNQKCDAEKRLWEPPEHLKNHDTNAYNEQKNNNISTQRTTNQTYTYAPPKTEAQEESVIELDYRNAYQSRQIFTRNEWQNYKKLRQVAEVKGYIICPKVRLLDIIEPRRGEKKYKTLLYKVQSKHVDFVICDQDMYIKAIIELDDSSHDRADRKERDEFVDLILRSVGYKVIHTRYIDYDILDLI